MPPVLDDALELLASPLKHERVTGVTAHRPWPMPERSWVMAQTWCDLLFVHWELAPESLASLVPPQLELDTFGGRAWLGVTPFEVLNLRLRPTPPVPVLSRFPEINVRTYVLFGGKPGIFFFSLDADTALGVAAARRLYRLPYFRSRMAIERDGLALHYSSERNDSGGPPAAFRGSYRGLGAPRAPAPGTLEHWLTERYCLYTLDDRQHVHIAEIHHPPWPLEDGSAEIDLNTMAEPLGLELQGPPLLHYATRQDVVFWSLEPAA